MRIFSRIIPHRIDWSPVNKIYNTTSLPATSVSIRHRTQIFLRSAPENAQHKRKDIKIDSNENPPIHLENLNKKKTKMCWIAAAAPPKPQEWNKYPIAFYNDSAVVVERTIAFTYIIRRMHQKKIN